MGQRRRRKIRHRGFRKPDTAIVALASLVVVLLLVWGGLYWEESSERALIVHAGGEDQVDRTLREEGGLQTTDSEDLSSGVEEQPSSAVGTDAPVEQSDNKPVTEPGKENDTKTGSQGTAEPQGTPEPESEGNAGHESPNDSVPESPTLSKPDSPSPSESESPSATPTDPPISKTQKYEQEITQVQAMCTKDMNEALSGAESGIRQLDRSDPYAVKEWNDKWTKEMEAAESKCDGDFQAVTNKADNDSVSPNVIEGWKETFSAMKVKLQGESKAKLQQLMGG
ncbi:hypothetical protein [Cohnella luojiensis]|uniref:Uncharacterized protein n=1 Tax=Cohnella luojiensis TaxID=652876 RepID=A0A4Y8M0Z7_9BACL|nr:hypothetical protein [Cohnella luojiensis]TFE28168.1 hypothetical protein E2980_08105 [Cohnella luojiensis]